METTNRSNQFVHFDKKEIIDKMMIEDEEFEYDINISKIVLDPEIPNNSRNEINDSLKQKISTVTTSGIQSRLDYIKTSALGIQNRADHLRSSGNKANDLMRRSVEKESDGLVTVGEFNQDS